MTQPHTLEFTLPGGDDVQKTASFFVETVGFHLWTIYPADDPKVAILTYPGGRLRLDRGLQGEPGELRLLGPNGREALTAPNGTRILFEPEDPWPTCPSPAPELTMMPAPQSDADWAAGRAGMLYRDLIPSRWGGHCIASHIRIPEAGPVPDQVHFHKVTFQIIYCLKGWVRLVYQDQGAPFIMAAGECVLQPPEIRHRVLESSGELEVLEVGIPAEHPTHFDTEMPLPNGPASPDLLYNGQRFVLFRSPEVPEGPEVDLGIGAATMGQFPVVRHKVRARSEKKWGASQRGRLLYGLSGDGRAMVSGAEPFNLSQNGAIALPPGLALTLTAQSTVSVLEVAL